MEKLKSCSFYFLLQSISKKYFLFIFITVVFVTNGFFISKAYAYEESNTTPTAVSFTGIVDDITNPLIFQDIDDSGEDIDKVGDENIKYLDYIVNNEETLANQVTEIYDDIAHEDKDLNKDENFNFIPIEENNVILNNAISMTEDSSLIQDFFNITISSDSEIEIIKEIIPGSAIIYIPATGKEKINILLGNLPNNDLYFYTDTLEETLQYSVNDSRAMTFSLDGQRPHLIFIKSQHSTKTIRNDETGGDCTAFGVWNKDILTCTMTKDLSEVVEIVSDGITLDGNGKMIKWGNGMGIGSGINVSFRKNITVKNLIVEGFDYGFGIFQTSNSSFINNETRGFGMGFYLAFNDSNILLEGNLVTNKVGYLPGIDITSSGMYVNGVKGVNIINNTISVTDIGVALLWVQKSKVYNNNFLSPKAIVSTGNSYGNYLYQKMPAGGNYYSEYNISNEGCSDINNDFICDSPISFGNLTDTLPWIYKNGWKGERIPEEEKNEPMIIIPGIMGTYLNKNYGDYSEVWPNISKVILPFGDTYLNDLAFSSSGTENLEKPMSLGDIIREIPAAGLNVFSGLVSELEYNGGYVENENLFVFPYDWRLSSVQNAKLLKDKIEEIVISSNSGKVDIIAHSMGGLLAKQYIQANGEEKIDHLIFLGTPHLGAPKSFKALMYGDSMGFEKLSIPLLSPIRVKTISQNMPSIFELLPSRKYVEDLRYVSEKILGSDPTYFDYNAINNFLKEKGENINLIQSTDIFHQGIDDMDLSNIKVSNISACGEPTISAINIRKKYNVGPFSFSEDYKINYTNGDGTVPLDSATGVSSVTKYFVDKVGHSAIPSAGNVPSAILNILENKPVSTDSILFEDINKCTPINGAILSVHSPITLDLYDDEGNHSGFDVNGNIENNILGVSYDTIDEAKFVFIPEGLNVTVKGIATNSGSFDLAVEKVEDSKTIETKFWNDIKITSTSQMNFYFNSYNEINTIEINNDGNKTNIPSSNILSSNQDYLNVPAVAVETRKHSSSGSSVLYNPKIIAILPDLLDVKVKRDTLLSAIKKTNIEKQKTINKSLTLLNKKETIINQKIAIPVSNLSASAANAVHDFDLWGIIKSFFRWLLHIKK